MERDIARGTRKWIFDAGSQINLKPETIQRVVKKLEKLFLFGIDLNGRLFETFLNATMRGKDLGQFFHASQRGKTGRKTFPTESQYASARREQAYRSGAGRLLQNRRIPDWRAGEHAGKSGYPNRHF